MKVSKLETNSGKLDPGWGGVGATPCLGRWGPTYGHTGAVLAHPARENDAYVGAQGYTRSQYAKNHGQELERQPQQGNLWNDSSLSGRLNQLEYFLWRHHMGAPMDDTCYKESKLLSQQMLSIQNLPLKVESSHIAHRNENLRMANPQVLSCNAFFFLLQVKKYSDR